MSFVYRGLKAEKERYIVTKEDVQQQIESILHENAKIEHVTDRPAQLGDEVIIDYAGFCDGEQFAGGTAEKQPLTLGSGRFIPGFEEQLVGKEIGEEVIVSVTFPKAYHAENLAGKAAEFHCKIHEIHAKTTYEPDDEFAKEFGECETMEEFREKLAASMQAFIDEKAEMDLQDRLLRMAADSFEFAPSEEEIEKETGHQLEHLSAELAQQGLNLEMYCQFTGNTIEQIKAEVKDGIAESLRLKAAVEKIAELENVTAEEDEINHAIGHVARQNGMTVEQIKEFCNDEFEEAVVHSIITGKVMSLIREAAEVTEV